MDNRLIALHRVIQELRAQDAWFMAAQLEKTLEELYARLEGEKAA